MTPRKDKSFDRSINNDNNNPFLLDEQEMKITKTNYRDLKFKVGIEIAEDGKVEHSFGLRHME